MFIKKNRSSFSNHFTEYGILSGIITKATELPLDEQKTYTLVIKATDGQRSSTTSLMITTFNPVNLVTMYLQMTMEQYLDNETALMYDVFRISDLTKTIELNYFQLRDNEVHDV